MKLEIFLIKIFLLIWYFLAFQEDFTDFQGQKLKIPNFDYSELSCITCHQKILFKVSLGCTNLLNHVWLYEISQLSPCYWTLPWEVFKSGWTRFLLNQAWFSREFHNCHHAIEQCHKNFSKVGGLGSSTFVLNWKSCLQ